MRCLYSLRPTALVLTMLACSAAAAQMVELSGGTSTLYQAQGGTVTIHGQQMETSFGAGLVQHRFAAGGSSTRRVPAGSLTAGQQELRLDLPTDVFDESHLLFGTGLGLREQKKSGSRLTLFAGGASQEGGTPLFDTVAPHGATLFGDWRMRLSSQCSFESMALFTRGGSLSSNSNTVLGSAECAVASGMRVALTSDIGGGTSYHAASVQVKRRRFELKAAYIDAGSRFQRGDAGDGPTPEPIGANVSAALHLSRSLSVSGMHRNYLTPASVSLALATTASPMRSSLDQLSLESHGRDGGWQVSLLRSTAHQAGMSLSPAWNGADLAVAAGWSHTFGRVQWTENWLHANERGAGTTSLLVSGVSLNLNPHLTLTESANISGALQQGDVTFSHGGTWLTSFSSISVSYQLLYLANRPGRPFQQTMVFDAGTRMFRGLSVHAASSVSPTGTVLYTFQLGRVFARGGGASRTLIPELGVYALRGRVIDSDGSPIEGAAMMVGDERVYTDSDGDFLYRERRGRTHPLQVLPEEFLSMEHYVVVSAPGEVSTRKDGPSITVVVARLQGERTAVTDAAAASVIAVQGGAKQ